jgi:hypothetical protein
MRDGQLLRADPTVAPEPSRLLAADLSPGLG